MAFSSRWQRVQTYAALGALYNKVYMDEDGELTFKDTPEILMTAGYLSLVWSPQIAIAIPATAALTVPLAVLEGAVLIGAGVSYAIGGVEGVEQYFDYITDPVDIVKDPEKRTALAQAVEIELALLNPIAWLAGQGGQYLGRTMGEYKSEIFRNRWLTAPYLSF